MADPLTMAGLRSFSCHLFPSQMIRLPNGHLPLGWMGHPVTLKEFLYIFYLFTKLYNNQQYVTENYINVTYNSSLLYSKKHNKRALLLVLHICNCCYIKSFHVTLKWLRLFWRVGMLFFKTFFMFSKIKFYFTSLHFSPPRVVLLYFTIPYIT